ncbi:MAG TPA: OmpH family outer membrane protein [Candidatus Cryptobacteroides excrementigallinarum]|nr:OmpH family outer membrane protein [Candidatus Cryptobacteroides excrementigallinarum]
MKKLPIILSVISLLGVIALAVVVLTGKTAATTGTANAETAEAGAANGTIVYFNLDKVLNEYDMANDLRSVVETKVNSINQEVNRRGTKLDQDIRSFQEKINKGLMTQSVAETQSQKLSQQQNEFQTYAAQKQQEVVEEQTVMMNQIADAINSYMIEYNAEKKYSLIIATQGDILPLPLVTGDSTLDITDDFLEGLNAAYVKSKASKE